MALTSAMMIGFTGINSNGVAVDTVGDNLANLNTTAFKGQRTLFETLLYRTISEGQAPDDESGGTLPRQFGLGSDVASIQRNFRQGTLEDTGFSGDLAVEGDGFFLLARPDGANVFTRDGSFRLDAGQTLVSAAGLPVQVFPADASGMIDQGTLSDLVIPIGATSPAIATTQVVMDGRFDPRTAVASEGAIVTSQPMMTSLGTPAAAGTALTELVDVNGVPLFATGDVLSIRGSKGGIATPEATFVVGTNGSTVGDLAGALQDTLAIQTDPATGDAPGVTVSDGSSYPAGSLVVRSNFGEFNAVELDAGSITNTTAGIRSPFAFTTVVPAVGPGVTTSFQVFDSLGNPLDVRLRFALESKSDTGITWRFYAESLQDTDPSAALGTGTVTFDANGQFVAATGTDVRIDRTGVGTVSPLTFNLDFGAATGLASADGTSQVLMDSQNGVPPGILTSYDVDAQGVITAAFSNQQTQVLGQVALATFANNEGLVALSENTFAVGPDSGDANILAPTVGRGGGIRAGALEQSNVEIAREFINLIAAATGISSSSRVVRVADELLQELLLIAR